MSESAIAIRFGGYAPAETTHGRAMARFREALVARLGDRVSVSCEWNILDTGARSDALLTQTESGALTLCYFSTSPLASRAPGLAVLDLPFLFTRPAEAHDLLDGTLGQALSAELEAGTAYRVLGFWDNGMRHVSNRLHPVHGPADLAGMRIRLQANAWHERLFQALGAEPVLVDLQEAIVLIGSGGVDAQENPLANTFTYGVGAHHRYLTLTGHLYGARGVYAHAPTFDAWPRDVQEAVGASVGDAVRQQRSEAGAAEERAREQLQAQGVEILELDEAGRAAFRAAASPVVAAFRNELGEQGERLLRLVGWRG